MPEVSLLYSSVLKVFSVVQHIQSGLHFFYLSEPNFDFSQTSPTLPMLQLINVNFANCFNVITPSLPPSSLYPSSSSLAFILPFLQDSSEHSNQCNRFLPNFSRRNNIYIFIAPKNISQKSKNGHSRLMHPKLKFIHIF